MTHVTEVEARWDDDGRVTVRSFTWQGQRQAVSSQGRQWVADDGRHVLVMTAGERVVELVHADTGWQLRQGSEGRKAAT
jgi:hypothetical protein